MDVTAEQHDTLMKDLKVFLTLSSTIHGVMLWDLVLCFPAEVKHIFWPDLLNLVRRGVVPSLTSFLLLLSRLLVIPAISLGKSFTEGQPSNCMAVYRACLYLHAMGSSTAAAVFVVRTLAIRSSRWPLALTLWFLWAAQTGGWLFWASQATVDQVPRVNSYTSTCQNISSKSSWGWIMFPAFGLFDLLILILTLELYIRHFGSLPFAFTSWRREKRADVSERFFEDTVLYFILSFTIATLEVVWILSHLHRSLYTALMGPVHSWLTLCITPRAIRNIKLHTAKKGKMTGGGNHHHNSVGTYGLSSINEAKRNHYHPEKDMIQFDTSILERVGAAEHFYPPAHQVQLKSVASSTPQLEAHSSQSDTEKGVL